MCVQKKWENKKINLFMFDSLITLELIARCIIQINLIQLLKNNRFLLI